ncbi:MAG TPA: DUF4189 domain-containing protein [Burkholderiales bacterium]|jgi:hypothetical protein|nr:DUF4189 domain-containing protein [Burkholderiales bacterium]
MRALVLLLGLVVLPAEAARQSSIPNRFGAIAYHRDSQSWGISYDKARARDAAVEALRQCGQQRCEIVHRFKNGCAALVDGPKAALAASGATRDEAETKALKRCGSGCKPIAWACTR